LIVLNIVLQTLTFGIPFLVGLEFLPKAIALVSVITAYITAIKGEADRLEQDEFRDNSDGKVFERLDGKQFMATNSTIGVSFILRAALAFGTYWIGTQL
jgi:hypothetical protein